MMTVDLDGKIDYGSIRSNLLSINGLQEILRHMTRSLPLAQIVAKVGAVASVEHPDPTKMNISCHLLRHTFARQWKKDPTRSRESLSKMLGHASVATTEDEYGTETIQDVQENYDRAIGDMYS
jgi:integrase